MSIPRHLEFELVPEPELNEALKQVRELQNGAPVLASPARWGALTLTAKGAGAARFRTVTRRNVFCLLERNTLQRVSLR